MVLGCGFNWSFGLGANNLFAFIEPVLGKELLLKQPFSRMILELLGPTKSPFSRFSGGIFSNLDFRIIFVYVSGPGRSKWH